MGLSDQCKQLVVQANAVKLNSFINTLKNKAVAAAREGYTFYKGYDEISRSNNNRINIKSLLEEEGFDVKFGTDALYDGTNYTSYVLISWD